MAGKNLLLVSFHDILGVEGGAVPRGREECSGRPRKGLGEGEGSSQGSRERSERKGGRRAKRRGIVDGDGEEVPTDQLLWARKGGRGEVDESKGRTAATVRQVVGKMDWAVRAEGGEVEARGPGAGVSSAKRADGQQAPQLCSGQQSGSSAASKAHSAQSGLEQ